MIQDLKIKWNDSLNQIKGKDDVIQIIQDELTATQLELSTKERNLEKLQFENHQLLERWLKLKSDEVRKVNEANEIIETARNITTKINISGIKATLGSFFGSGNVEDRSPSKEDSEPQSWPNRPVDAVELPQRVDRTLVCWKPSY
jgi:autophagy-related protein 16